MEKKLFQKPKSRILFFHGTLKIKIDHIYTYFWIKSLIIPFLQNGITWLPINGHGWGEDKYLKKNRYLPGKPKYFITIVYMSIKKKYVNNIKTLYNWIIIQSVSYFAFRTINKGFIENKKKHIYPRKL